MALFINVDPVAAKWWKRKVYRGWQFGYSGGTENDFMIDIELAKWRLVCYIGFKKVQNFAPGYERHLKWRKEQELARKRANKPEPAFKRFWRKIRGTQASGYRMDQKRSEDDKTPPMPEQFLAAIDKLRFGELADDDHDQGGGQLAARPGLPEPIHRAGASPIEGELLRQVDQGPAPDHHHKKEPEARGLPREKTP